MSNEPDDNKVTIFQSAWIALLVVVVYHLVEPVISTALIRWGVK